MGTTFPILKIVQIDIDKNFYSENESYCNWYWYKCPNCGCKIEWTDNDN